MEPRRPDNFQEFIYQVLLNFKMEPERAQRYVDEAGMEKWIQAFTHELVNPSFNYESLEMLGDYVLKSVFTRYLMIRFKGLDPAAINNTNQNYMSENFQPKLAKMLGFDKELERLGRTPKVTDKLLEDTFEAFVGALYEVAESKDSMGRAFIEVYNFINWLFKDIPIDIDQYGPKKTWVNQTITRFKLEIPFLNMVRRERRNYAYELLIDQTTMDFFANRGIYLEPALGIGYGATQAEASDNTYIDAFEKMISAGITREWVNKEKTQFEFKAPELQPYLQKARENLKKLGYQSMYFNTGLTTEKAAGKEIVVSLIGVKETTNEHIVIETAFASNELDAKKVLLKHLSEKS